MSRHQIGVATPLSPLQVRPPNGVATPFLQPSPQAMSRHQISVATPPRPIQVATPKPGRDPAAGYPISRHQIHVATPFLPIVGFPGRDTKNPGRDLPHCHPCRDLISMSRCRFRPTKADQVALPLPCRYLTSNQTRSRHQIDVATSTSPNPQRTPFFFFFFKSSDSLPCYSQR